MLSNVLDQFTNLLMFETEKHNPCICFGVSNFFNILLEVTLFLMKIMIHL